MLFPSQAPSLPLCRGGRKCSGPVIGSPLSWQVSVPHRWVWPFTMDGLKKEPSSSGLRFLALRTPSVGLSFSWLLTGDGEEALAMFPSPPIGSLGKVFLGVRSRVALGRSLVQEGGPKDYVACRDTRKSPPPGHWGLQSLLQMVLAVGLPSVKQSLRGGGQVAVPYPAQLRPPLFSTYREKVVLLRDAPLFFPVAWLKVPWSEGDGGYVGKLLPFCTSQLAHDQVIPGANKPNWLKSLDCKDGSTTYVCPLCCIFHVENPCRLQEIIELLSLLLCLFLF